MQEGDTLECKGPIVKFDYKPNMKKAIGMVSEDASEYCSH